MTNYCLDTSFLINSWTKYYPISMFPGLWELIDQYIADGTIGSCEEVYKEIEAEDDDLFAWAKKRKHLFRSPCEHTLQRMHDVMRRFPNFAAVGGSMNRADPFIIAHSIQFECVVVSDESAAPNSRPTIPPKIPDVCNSFALKCLKPTLFLKALGYVDTNSAK